MIKGLNQCVNRQAGKARADPRSVRKRFGRILQSGQRIPGSGHECAKAAYPVQGLALPGQFGRVRPTSRAHHPASIARPRVARRRAREPVRQSPTQNRLLRPAGRQCRELPTDGHPGFPANRSDLRVRKPFGQSARRASVLQNPSNFLLPDCAFSAKPPISSSTPPKARVTSRNWGRLERRSATRSRSSSQAHYRPPVRVVRSCPSAGRTFATRPVGAFDQASGKNLRLFRIRRKAPLPNLTSSTSPSRPAASFLERMEAVIKSTLSTVAVTSRIA